MAASIADKLCRPCARLGGHPPAWASAATVVAGHLECHILQKRKRIASAQRIRGEYLIELWPRPASVARKVLKNVARFTRSAFYPLHLRASRVALRFRSP